MDRHPFVRAELALALSLLGLACGCHSVETTWETRSDDAVATLATYRWLDDGVRRAPSTVADRQVRETTERALRQKGFALQQESPDFGIRVVFESGALAPVRYHRAPPRSMPLGMLLGFALQFTGIAVGVNPEACSMPSAPEDGGPEDETMRVDVVDVTSGRVLWRGRARGVFAIHGSDEERAAIVEEAALAVLAPLPHSRAGFAAFRDGDEGISSGTVVAAQPMP